jgi:hypothetical protein
MRDRPQCSEFPCTVLLRSASLERHMHSRTSPLIPSLDCRSRHSFDSQSFFTYQHKQQFPSRTFHLPSILHHPHSNHVLPPSSTNTLARHCQRISREICSHLTLFPHNLVHFAFETLPGTMNSQTPLGTTLTTRVARRSAPSLVPHVG